MRRTAILVVVGWVAVAVFFILGVAWPVGCFVVIVVNIDAGGTRVNTPKIVVVADEGRCVHAGATAAISAVVT